MYILLNFRKKTRLRATLVSYLDLLLSIGWNRQFQTSIYDKCDDFNLHITNFRN